MCSLKLTCLWLHHLLTTAATTPTPLLMVCLNYFGQLCCPKSVYIKILFPCTEMLESRTCSCHHFSKKHNVSYQCYMLHPTSRGFHTTDDDWGKKCSKPLPFCSPCLSCSAPLTSPLQLICMWELFLIISWSLESLSTVSTSKQLSVVMDAHHNNC